MGAQVKVVFLMHDTGDFNGAQDGASGLYVYPNVSDADATYGDSLAALGERCVPGSSKAKLAFGTKTHDDANAAKTAMGVGGIDVSDGTGSTWALSEDSTELSLTVDFASKTNLNAWQTKFVAFWENTDLSKLVWQDKSKGAWDSY